MDIDGPAVTSELFSGVIGLVVGLALGIVGHILRMIQVNKEHQNQIDILERKLSAQEQHRKEDKEDLEIRERIEALTSGINDPEALRRMLEMQGLMKLQGSRELKSEGKIVGASSRMRLLLFVLVIALVVVAAFVLLPR